MLHYSPCLQSDPLLLLPLEVPKVGQSSKTLQEVNLEADVE